MKLKKIASLMLAGVMAVSMLAGCSNGTKPDDDKKDPVVDSSLAGQVIAALDEDTTKNITFSTNTSLQTALEKVAQNKGTNISNIQLSDLKAIDPDLVDDEVLNVVAADNAINAASKDASKNDSKSDTISVIVKNLSGNYSEEYIAQQIANTIDNQVKDLKIADTTESITYTYEDNDFHYDFDYTGEVAVVKATNAVNGQVSYFAIFNITRTATKVVEA